MRKNIALVCLTALVVAGAVPAFGAVKDLITSKDIKNHTIRGKDIKRRTIGLTRLKHGAIRSLRGSDDVGTPTTPGAQGEGGAAGPQGTQGPAGANGTNGTNGADGAPGSDAFSTAKWGVIGKDTLGSPVADYRVGPWDAADGANPPAGVGSLWLAVEGPSPGETPDADPEKVHFGNEFDFRGDEFSTLDTLSYWIYADEDNLAGHDAPNMSIEVVGAPVGTASGYTTLVRNPTVTDEREWFKENASDNSPQWYSSRPFTDAAAGMCTQGSPCGYDTLKGLVTSAAILSIGVGKGRDNPFTGAVDALQVNDTVYDFEPGGTFPTPAP